MSRPNILWPNIATDAVYTSGQSNTLPTKVDPGLAARKQGILPGRVAAANENFKAYSVEQLAKHLDGINVCNWHAPVDTHCVTVSTIDDMVDIVWSSAYSQAFVSGLTFVDTSEMGRVWLAMTMPATPPTFDVLAEQNGFIWAGGFTSSKATIFNGTVWAAYVSPANSRFWSATGKSLTPVGNKFLIGGSNDSAPYVPRIWTVPAASTPIFTQAAGIVAPSGYQTAAPNGVDMIASSPTLCMCMASDARSGGGTDIAYWTSSDGTTWTLRRISSPSVQVATNLVWEPTYGFSVTDLSGHIYSSADGIAWALRVTSVGAQFVARRGTLSTSDTGGTWVCVADSTALVKPGRACFSVDQGATWNYINESFDDITGSAHKIVKTKCLDGAGRFAMVCASNQSGNFHHFVSMSLAIIP